MHQRVRDRRKQRGEESVARTEGESERTSGSHVGEAVTSDDLAVGLWPSFSGKTRAYTACFVNSISENFADLQSRCEIKPKFVALVTSSVIL